MRVGGGQVVLRCVASSGGLVDGREGSGGGLCLTQTQWLDCGFGQKPCRQNGWAVDLSTGHAYKLTGLGPLFWGLCHLLLPPPTLLLMLSLAGLSSPPSALLLHTLLCRCRHPFLSQDMASLGLATFTAEPSSGGIAAKGELAVEVTVHTSTLGRIQLPVRIKVIGSRGAPLQCIADAKSIGPHLLFGANPEARWVGGGGGGGLCACLRAWACVRV